MTGSPRTVLASAAEHRYLDAEAARVLAGARAAAQAAGVCRRTCLPMGASSTLVFPVSGTRIEQREDQQFRGSAFELTIERTRIDT